MHELIRRARLRLLNQELISQGAITVAAGLAAFIVLLLLGIDALTWYWAALIPLAAVGAGVYLALQRRPSSYRAAQVVDHRLALADTLSTAVYFDGRAEAQAPDSQEVVRSQRESAEQAARTVDLRQAIPYSMPRSAYVVVALALVASSLFALRYGFNKRLDLRAPLARIIRDEFTPRDRKETAENMRRVPQPYDNPDDSNDAAADKDQKGPDKQDAKSDDAGQQGDEQNSEKSGASKDDGKKQGGDPQSQDGDAQSQQSDDRDQQDSGQANPNSQGQDKGNSDKQADGKQQSNNGSESGSLMSKLKDFAENLLSKVKPQQQNGQAPQQAANQNAKQNQGQQNGKQPQKDGQQSGSQQAESQEGQNGDDQKNGQDSQGKGSGQDKSQQATKQPGSGVGSEDGSKEIRQAEQLAAMGKISELIGKRSATVTGEATVEVQSTSQQLHTAYVKSGAEHSQAGAEISRDEIPVALQPYVEQYFDQLRKQPATVKKQ